MKENGGFLKWGLPLVIIHLNGIFHSKPSSCWDTPIVGGTPMVSMSTATGGRDPPGAFLEEPGDARKSQGPRSGMGAQQGGQLVNSVSTLRVTV